MSEYMLKEKITGLADLGYSDTKIEFYFIPAMALRNYIDSAHVDLSIFTREQLRVLHAYTEVAENVFRVMLRRLVAKTHEGHAIPVQYGEPSRRSEAVKNIGRIAEHCVGLKGFDKQSSQERSPCYQVA